MFPKRQISFLHVGSSGCVKMSVMFGFPWLSKSSTFLEIHMSTEGALSLSVEGHALLKDVFPKCSLIAFISQAWPIAYTQFDIKAKLWSFEYFYENYRQLLYARHQTHSDI